MKPAERIPLLTKLATVLSDKKMPHANMNLILRQHGFSSGDVFFSDSDGDTYVPARYELVLHHLETSGDDETLLELQRFLDPAADGISTAPPATLAPGPWKSKTAFRLFISHTHTNAKLASGIKTFLGKYGIECFVAHNDITPSAKWIEVIRSGLLTTHALTALVTPDFRDSQWCDQEIGFALARSMLVIPVMCGAAPYGFLNEFQAIKLKDHRSAWLTAMSIFKTLATHKETRDRMAGPVVRRYAKSQNFEETSAAFALLARIPKGAWTPELVNECNLALEDNSQVKKAKTSANGLPIPDAAAKLLAPIEKQLGMDSDDIPF